MNERETEAMADSIELAADALTEVASLTERLREAEALTAPQLAAENDRLEARVAELEDEVERYKADQERERPFVAHYREARTRVAELEAEVERLATGIDECDGYREQYRKENERLQAEAAEGHTNMSLLVNKLYQENERLRKDKERAEDLWAEQVEENERLRNRLNRVRVLIDSAAGVVHVDDLFVALAEEK